MIGHSNNEASKWLIDEYQSLVNLVNKQGSKQASKQRKFVINIQKADFWLIFKIAKTAVFLKNWY